MRSLAHLLSTFTASHRGGSGTPLVCLHGFTDTWRTWDLVLPELERYRRDWLPQADWVELDGVGHCPQLDVPLETAQLIVGFTAG